MPTSIKDTISARLARRIQAAQGALDADLVIKGVSFLDVFAGEWRAADIAVIDGTIVGTEPGLRAKRVIEAKGRHLVPGFIDAHVHVESSLMTPDRFQASVLPRGTTTAVCDPHEIANVRGVSGIRYFLDESARLALDLRVMLSSCVPATHLETNGGGTIRAADLIPFAAHPKALGLAEMMNMPGVLHADPSVLEKLEAFQNMPIDGHCPLLRGAGLSAYAATGISSCHESSELGEAREKLGKGIAVWIREGSVAKDLEALIPLLHLATSTSIGFCTDDRNPLDILEEGHVDHLVRSAIRAGVAPEVAYRSASWTVARHYGLDRGISRTGAIAPGYRADLVLLDDVASCAVAQVWVGGVNVAEIAAPAGNTALEGADGSVRAAQVSARDLEGPSGQVHVIHVRPGKILTGRAVEAHDAPGVARLSVLERHGHGSRPANGYARGFGEKLIGAIGSSVGHDSHNLIAVGASAEDMAVAFRALSEMGGGFCVVQAGKVIASLPLPIAGLMSPRTPEELTKSLHALKNASRSIGCELPEPFLQLAFLSLPVIPSLKLTDKGLVDVDRFEIISVRAG